MDNGKTGGMIDLVMLRDLTDRGEIDTVIIAFPDLYGRLLGKRVSADFFLNDVASHGIHACDYLLTADMEMEPDTGYRFSGWEKGYGDMAVVPDWSTLRVATWLPKTAIVLGDLVNAGGPVRIAPRAILRAQLKRAAKAGYRPMGAAELEFFLFDEMSTAAQCLERDVQLVVVERAVERGDHVLDLLRILGDGEPSGLKLGDEGRLSDCVHRRAGSAFPEVAGEDVGGVDHLILRRGDPESGQFFGVVGAGLERFVGEKDDPPPAGSQLGDCPIDARDQPLAQVYRSIEIK